MHKYFDRIGQFFPSFQIFIETKKNVFFWSHNEVLKSRKINETSIEIFFGRKLLL